MQTVDEYISNAPKPQQPMLKQLRALIKKTAPKAEEKLSYGMPYYGYHGRLAYFRSAKKHIGLYLMPTIIAANKTLLKNYVTAKATIQLPLDKILPAPLITKLVKASMTHNEKNTVKKKRK